MSSLDRFSPILPPDAGRADRADDQDPIAAPEQPRAPDGRSLPVPGRAEAAALRGRAVKVGLALAKSGGPEGTERLLSEHHARKIEKLFERAPAAVVRQLEADLARIGGPGAEIGRALYLKAAAARLDDLVRPGRGGDRRVLLDALAAFASRLDGMRAADMLARATVLDLDSRRNTSEFDPMGLYEDEGDPTWHGTDDERADNDGLFQRFTASCGTTTLQVLLCEEDPLRAFAIHDAGLTEPSSTDLAAAFQAEVLEAYGGVAISRLAEHRFILLKKEITRLRREGEVGDKALDDLKGYILGTRDRLTQPARRALEAIRAASTEGFPTAADLEEIRAARFPREDEGLGMEAMQRVLDDHLTPITGVTYAQTDPPEGFGPGKAKKHLDDVERALRSGIDVPFGISEPPHWMLLSAVEGEKPERRFLVTDPGAGRTAWVEERSLVKGTFIEHPFEFVDEHSAEKEHIDSFYLPETVA